MPTMDSALEVCRAFIEDRKPTRRLASLLTMPAAVFSYGEHWPLLAHGSYVRNADAGLTGAYLVNVGKASATTSRHQRAAERALESAGFTDTGERVTDTPKATYYGYSTYAHTYAVWRPA